MKRSADPTILYTTADGSPQSGAFRQVLDMSERIGEWGYRSVLVVPESPPSRWSDARSVVHVMPLPRPKKGLSMDRYASQAILTARSVRCLVEIIRRERVTLVHVNEVLDIYGAIAARIAGVPCVCHLRADLSSAPAFIQAWLPRFVLALSTRVVAVSASAAEHAFRNGGTSMRKVSVIHDPGPDPFRFNPRVDGSSVRREFRLTDDSFLVVLIAKLSWRKGHDVLLRAVPKVLASFPDTHFLVVGGEMEGPHHQAYARSVRRLAVDLGIMDAVHFVGYRADIPQIIAAADIVTHCSTYPDPFPGVVLQALAMGTPVIASDLGGPREQIEDRVSGLLVPPKDPAVLADAVCSLLSDPERRFAMGSAAASKVATEFTSDSFYRELASLYRQLAPPY